MKIKFNKCITVHKKIFYCKCVQWTCKFFIWSNWLKLQDLAFKLNPIKLSSKNNHKHISLSSFSSSSSSLPPQGLPLFSYYYITLYTYMYVFRHTLHTHTVPVQATEWYNRIKAYRTFDNSLCSNVCRIWRICRKVRLARFCWRYYTGT